MTRMPTEPGYYLGRWKRQPWEVVPVKPGRNETLECHGCRISDNSVWEWGHRLPFTIPDNYDPDGPDPFAPKPRPADAPRVAQVIGHDRYDYAVTFPGDKSNCPFVVVQKTGEFLVIGSVDYLTLEWLDPPPEPTRDEQAAKLLRDNGFVEQAERLVGK